jgi:hypothetical protein
LFEIENNHQYALYHKSGKKVVGYQESWIRWFGDKYYGYVIKEKHGCSLFDYKNNNELIYEGVNYFDEGWVYTISNPIKLISLNNGIQYILPKDANIWEYRFRGDSIVFIEQDNSHYFYHVSNKKKYRVNKNLELTSSSFPIRVRKGGDKISYMDSKGKVIFPFISYDYLPDGGLDKVFSKFYDGIAVISIYKDFGEYDNWIYHKSGYRQKVPYKLNVESFNGGGVIPVSNFLISSFINYKGEFVFTHPYRIEYNDYIEGTYHVSKNIHHVSDWSKTIIRYDVNCIDHSLHDEETLELD